MLYGYINRHNEGEIRSLTIENDERYTNPKFHQEEARKKIFEEQKLYTQRLDKNRLKNVTYNLGDIVTMKDAIIATGESTKFQKRYRGLLVITRILPSNTYGVAALKIYNRKRRYATTTHTN